MIKRIIDDVSNSIFGNTDGRSYWLIKALALTASKRAQLHLTFENPDEIESFNYVFPYNYSSYQEWLKAIGIANKKGDFLLKADEIRILMESRSR